MFSEAVFQVVQFIPEFKSRDVIQKLKVYHAMKSLPLYRQLTPLSQIVGLRKPAVHSRQQDLSLVELEEFSAAVKLYS